jgi:alkylation response protein AidB-like acyl-CoA dehydrogenase
MNQGIQHPLAKCWAQLEAANLMVMKAATLFDQGLDCGVEANAGISCRTIFARKPDSADCAGEPAHDP